MKTLLAACLFAALLPGADRVVMNLEKSPYARVKSVPVSAVTMAPGFWQPRMKVNVERSIPTLLLLLEEHGIVDNFRRLAGKSVPRKGPLFTDSDIYKWMEAAAFVLQTTDDPKLRATFDKLTDEILAAQEPSGYLNTYWVEDRKDRRWKEMHTGHELYCLGHMLQAGIAYYRATGNRKLMDGGIRFVEYLLRDFGPGKQPLYAGHPEIELALIELYRTTGRKEFLDLAGHILQGDGVRLKLTPQQMSYTFSGRPFTSRTTIEGHAVRVGYAASGAADYYLETGDAAYKSTLETLWKDMTTGKMYVTGATGALYDGVSPDGSKNQSSIQRVHQAYGRPYQLPNVTAYNESCATIGWVLWNWRMLAITGQARYAAMLELALYNGVLASISLDGREFFYTNPLARVEKLPFELRWSRKREPYISCFCCPPNIVRTVAEVAAYAYSVSDDGLWLNLYGGSVLDTRLADGSAIRLTQETEYPWEGTIQIVIEDAPQKEFSLFLRIPDWAEGARVSVQWRTHR